MSQFEDYAYYYNAFYKDKDYKKEARDADILLKRYGKNIKKIIVYGCGTGNHDVEMAKLGYDCFGIDLSTQMIEMAKDRANAQNLKLGYEVADIREYTPHDKYDAVISLFHVMSYQTTNEDIKNAFQSARAALDCGGVFLFDVWYGPGVLTDPPTIRIKEVEDDKNRLIRLCRPSMHADRDLVDVNYDILVIDKGTGNMKSIKETHHMRYYFRPEIEEYLSKAGFKMLNNLDCRTLEETDYSSWTSYLIAEAV